MKNDDYIDLIQAPLTPKTRKCKLLVQLLALFLTYAPFLIAGLFFIYFDLFIGIISLIFSYIVIGIIRSKIRIISIPPAQLEYTYDDYTIASWYLLKHYCYENLEKNSNLPSV